MNLFSRLLVWTEILLVSLGPALVEARPSIELTDTNFEHDTQASTGGTTGDWLVLFCEPNRFSHCSELIPMWEELSHKLAGLVNVAHVDV